MEIYIKESAYIVALLAESVAVVIILLGILKTTFFYIKNGQFTIFQPDMISSLRIRLGSALSLSLEFLIGADILKTAISPDWNEIGMLGAIVLIRTVLNFFLTQELRPGPDNAKFQGPG